MGNQGYVFFNISVTSTVNRNPFSAFSGVFEAIELVALTRLLLRLSENVTFVA